MEHEAVSLKVTALFSITLMASVAFASPKRWTPAQKQIAELESRINLERVPGWEASGSSSLNAYERFYTGSKRKGNKVILGELVLPTEPAEHPGLNIVSSSDNFPVISGGGCTIIHLVYSVPTNTITSIYCNGSI